jgi:hypothetical protein
MLNRAGHVLAVLLIAAAVAGFAYAAWSWAGLTMAGLAEAGAYGWSLHRNEWEDCPRCGARGRHHGMIASRARHGCGRCDGTGGEVVRLGVRVFRPARAQELLRHAGVDRPWWRG